MNIEIWEKMMEIEGRKEHSYAAATYKDLPTLREIEKILNEKLQAEHPCDRDTLVDSIFAVRFLGSAYESMWRIAYAVKYYKWLLELQVDLYTRFQEHDKQCADDYYTALRARNYYTADDCADLVELAKKLLSDNKRKQTEIQVFEHFHPLKHDPVELTDEYLGVIDEVEKIMDEKDAKKLHPFTQAELFQALLCERGVEWKSLMELNPGIHFD